MNESRFSMALSELIAQKDDMKIEDLLFNDAASPDPEVAASLHDVSRLNDVRRSPKHEKTPLHEICLRGSLQELVQRLESPPSLQARMTADRTRRFVNIVPTQEVTVCNEEGQLPLHLAAMTRRTIQEADGEKNRVEDLHQPAPGLVAALVTGRNPQNGKLLFEVKRDEAGGCEGCVAQDALGQTALHNAAMSDSTAALEVVCRLLEANPAAASVFDMDGLLPLDLACRNPSRGISSIVKLLLRAYPRAAIVEEHDTLASDWPKALDKTSAFYPIKTNSRQFTPMTRTTSLVEQELSSFPDGIVFHTESLPLSMVHERTEVCCGVLQCIVLPCTAM